MTLPDKFPPPTTMFPFTSILPPRLALEPTERMVPATGGELEAVILPVIVLLLARMTVPLLLTSPVMLTVPVVFTNLRLPVLPPLMLEELPICTLPGLVAPENSTKSDI